MSHALWGVLVVGCLLAVAAGGAWAAEPGRIVLRPQQGKMNAAAHVPGEGWVFALGMPETIGCRERMILNFPEVKIQWTGPDADGAVASEWTTAGRIKYAVRLVPGSDHVDVEMTITNLSEQLWHDVFAFDCVNPVQAEPFKDWKLARTWMSSHGKPMRMDGTRRVQGRMPTVGFYTHEQTPWGLESPFVHGFGATSPNRTDGAWIVTLSDPPGSYMAATSPDSLFLFDNLDRCCIHSAPSFGDIGPGESSTTVCRVYFADGGLDDFLKRYQADLRTPAPRQKWARPRRSRIELKGVTPPGVGKFGQLAFEMRAGWMKEPIRLRLPETLHSSLGLHFIDHDRKDMPPLSMLAKQPEWKADPATGEITYECTTAEGITFGGRVRPYEDEVYVEFRARNGTKKAIRNVFPQLCLSMAGSEQFGKTDDLSPEMTWIEGKLTSLAATTPTPAQMGKAPWIHLATTEAPQLRKYKHPTGIWWYVDQLADVPLMARRSADGKHLLAIWFEGAKAIMTNTRIPCMHSASPNVDKLAPGAEAVWRGKIYLMANDPEALKVRQTGDSGEWPYPRRQPPRR
ncbi:MAG TPA: hypothetical protein VM389_03115 [Phycisphaerae bacterium]|nr:hypothetical protein [Phycisphaerae bacterium]